MAGTDRMTPRVRSLQVVATRPERFAVSAGQSAGPGRHDLLVQGGCNLAGGMEPPRLGVRCRSVARAAQEHDMIRAGIRSNWYALPAYPAQYCVRGYSTHCVLRRRGPGVRNMVSRSLGIHRVDCSGCTAVPIGIARLSCIRSGGSFWHVLRKARSQPCDVPQLSSPLMKAQSTPGKTSGKVDVELERICTLLDFKMSTAFALGTI